MLLHLRRRIHYGSPRVLDRAGRSKSAQVAGLEVGMRPEASHQVTSNEAFIINSLSIVTSLVRPMLSHAGMNVTAELLIGLFVAYGYWIVFTAILLDNAGLPIPGEVLLLAFGVVAKAGH